MNAWCHCDGATTAAHLAPTRYMTALVTVAVQAGAMAAFLKELLLADSPYAEGVQEDFVRCMQIHFRVGDSCRADAKLCK